MTDEFNSMETPSSLPKRKGKTIILIIAALLLLLGGGAAYVFFVDPSLLVDSPGGDNVVTQSTAVTTDKIEQTIVPLEEILVNIRDREIQRLFKLKISIELLNSEDFTVVESKIPILLDTFQSHIRGMRISEIEGSRAIYRIKEELLSRANVVLHPIRVKNILFAEMLLQ